eukprot:gene9566-9729_t
MAASACYACHNSEIADSKGCMSCLRQFPAGSSMDLVDQAVSCGGCATVYVQRATKECFACVNNAGRSGASYCSNLGVPPGTDIPKDLQSVVPSYYSCLQGTSFFADGGSFCFGCLSEFVTSVAARRSCLQSTALELRNVIIKNCSSQAIVLVGPGASLTAVDVIFEGNTARDTLGVVISAGQADVVLEEVTIKSNRGASRAVTAASSKEYNPPCIDSSSTGTALPFPNAGSYNSYNRLWPAACGAPALLSSLLDIQSSNLTIINSVITENDADCVISAVGAAPQRLQLLQGTRTRGNNVNWLMVADSWPADSTGSEFLEATEFLDVVYYASYEGSTQGAFAINEEWHDLQQSEEVELKFDDANAPAQTLDWSASGGPKDDLEAQQFSADQYLELLGEVLSANREILDALSIDPMVCAASLQASLAAGQQSLAGRPVLRSRSPAVLWAMFSQGFVADTRVEGNTGFDHVLRIDNTYLVMKGFNMSYNSARNSAFDLWYSDVWVTASVVVKNKVQLGSVLDFESCRGTFDQVGA